MRFPMAALAACLTISASGAAAPANQTMEEATKSAWIGSTKLQAAHAEAISRGIRRLTLITPRGSSTPMAASKASTTLSDCGKRA